MSQVHARRHLPSAVPWISEDRLLLLAIVTYDMTDPFTEIPQVGAQLPEWRATLYTCIHVCNSMYICGETIAHHWINLRVLLLAEEC